jgi:hypothetical protein
MLALTGERLLAAWESGARAPELRRPLAMLSAAMPGSDLAALGAMTIAERDLLLLKLRQLTFGPELEVFGECPGCGEALEFNLRAGELAAHLEAAVAAAAAGPVEWAADGQRYRLRPVTTDDLAAALAVPDPEAAQEVLLARCLEVTPERAALPSAGTPSRSPLSGAATVAARSAAVARRFEELHGDTELRCAIDCPACGGHQVLDLDIARFLWREVRSAALRLLGEIHVLASAYGWPERDIVRLSPGRRAAYLELVSG